MNVKEQGKLDLQNGISRLETEIMLMTPPLTITMIQAGAQGMSDNTYYYHLQAIKQRLDFLSTTDES